MFLRNIPTDFVLPYLQMLALIEVVFVCVLFVVFFRRKSLIPVVEALVRFIEYFYVGIRGDFLHTIYVVLLFDGACATVF